MQYIIFSEACLFCQGIGNGQGPGDKGAGWPVIIKAKSWSVGKDPAHAFQFSAEVLVSKPALMPFETIYCLMGIGKWRQPPQKKNFPCYGFFIK